MNFRMLFLFLLVAFSCTAQQPTVQIIPQPSSISMGKGNFELSTKTVIAVKDEADMPAARFLRDYINQLHGIKLDIDRQESRNYIRINTRKFIQAPEADAYQLGISGDGVTIEGDTYAGSFHGVQTLLQLIPPQKNLKSVMLPQLQINDRPRFAYRGMHLDVARHFFPVAFIKKYIDYLAFHKMIYFHWHLTDDQGWRIEIKKYPELTATAGFRNGTIIGRYPGTANDNTRYGGYYTQDEVREIVQYAAARHITVVPEIEMPGHASAAIAAFPWLSCFPEKPTVIPTHPSEQSKKEQQQGRVKLVQETWGVFEDVFCAGKDSTFHFLENVLTEVLELFPSKHIHVGGDESPKTHWKKCPRCQARIRSEKLKDEHELQSYFIQRMEKFLNARGRILIGWDEILEGGLAPNAIVMSWRGEKGGVEAATQNHLVIMTPGKPVYFDHSQTRSEDSIVIGGFNPLDAVYQYEPVPKDLPADKHRYIWGAQANLWTEYVRYPSKVEYMVFPRMSALSEVLWTGKENRNWENFKARLPQQFRRYELWNANYSMAVYDLKLNIIPAPGNSGVQITTGEAGAGGRIELLSNGGAARPFSGPLIIKQSGTQEINYYKDDRLVNKFPLTFSFNKATGKKITVNKTPNSMYPGQGGGAFSLVNGIVPPKGLGHADWMGWIGEDVEFIIDLDKVQKISSMNFRTIDQNGSWIYLPKYVELLVSTDGKTYRSAGRTSSFVKEEPTTMGWMSLSFTPRNARFVKIIAKNHGLIGDGKPGAGNRAWIFAGEIQIQ